MAFDVTTDYTAKKSELEKALAAATDEATKASLQAQINAVNGSREEKIASDLTKYGKYANESELQGAAGIMANNQLGTGYDIQKKNLNLSFDQAKQNANNDALSRGMARSTFVSDRMANLDTSRASALSDIDASKALALQNAKTNIIDNYRTNTANALTAEKNEFAKTIGAYSNDYQAEINKVTGNNDASDDWKIPYLQQARNEKIAAQQAAALKAAKSSYSGGGGGVKSATMTYSQLNSALKQIKDSGTEEDMYNFAIQNGGQYTSQLLAIYGLNGYAPKPTYTPTAQNSTDTRVQSWKANGYTDNQIVANAKADYQSGAISAAEYQAIVKSIQVGAGSARRNS